MLSLKRLYDSFFYREDSRIRTYSYLSDRNPRIYASIDLCREAFINARARDLDRNCNCSYIGKCSGELSSSCGRPVRARRVTYTAAEKERAKQRAYPSACRARRGCEPTIKTTDASREAGVSATRRRVL